VLVDPGVELPADCREQGELHPTAARRLLDEPRVLGGEPQAEARLEVAVDHRPALGAQVAHVERPVRDRIEQELGVEAERLGERDRLCHALDDRDDPRVRDQLEPGAGARLADPQRPRADRVEDRLCALAQLVRA
jgi:hypothetical protein